MTSATIEDYKVFANEHNLTEEEEQQIEFLLEAAEDKILTYTNGMWTSRVTGKDITARSIQLELVRNSFDNQEGTISEGVDGWNVSKIESLVSGLRLTYEQKRELNNLRTRRGIGSISSNKGGGNVF